MKVIIIILIFIIANFSYYGAIDGSGNKTTDINEFEQLKIEEENKNVNETLTETGNADNELENQEKTMPSSTEIKNTDIKSSTSKNMVSSTQSSLEVQQEKTETKNNNNTQQIAKDEPIQEKVEKPKQETIVEQPVILGEEYKTNDTMINTIKNVIESNESEDMLLYGYNIVVDSSIIETTSQFTYTKQRVIDKIKYKFGTIKIYARDYYNNGQFICTQCYII